MPLNRYHDLCSSAGAAGRSCAAARVRRCICPTGMRNPHVLGGASFPIGLSPT